MRPTLVALTFVLLLTSLVEARLMQESPSSNPIQVKINTPLPVNQTASEDRHFEVVVPNPDSDQILVISAASELKIRIGIYISTSDSADFKTGVWPDWQTNTQECFYSSIDACAIHLPDAAKLPNGANNLTVYFTVTVSRDCTYELEVLLEKLFTIRPEGRYSVNFEKADSAIVQLPASSYVGPDNATYEQVIISCTYTSYKDIGQFRLLAKEGAFPTNDYSGTIMSKSLNAFMQILQLPPPSDPNTSYYILLEGSGSAKLNISVEGIQSSLNPQLHLNDTITYLTPRQLNYTYSGVFPSNVTARAMNPFQVELYAYRGSGQFQVDYCNSLYQFSFENSRGESGEIYISAKIRWQCYAAVSKQGGLLIENLQISITNVQSEFGYSIGLWEGLFSNAILPGYKEIGVLTAAKEGQNYTIGTTVSAVSYNLTCQALVGKLDVRVLQCKKQSKSCTKIFNLTIDESDGPIKRNKFTCASNSICYIEVSQTVKQVSKYTLLLTPAESKSLELKLDTPEIGILEMNEYIYYYINVSALRQDPALNFSNTTLITVLSRQVNGESIMLTSTKLPRPEYKDAFVEGSDVIYEWEGVVDYLVNKTYPEYIYVGLLGDTESIYHLQFVVNTSVNIPAAYIDMADDSENQFQLDKDTPYILAKYVSHILPYTITFTPTPTCVRYGAKLPLNSTCVPVKELPTEFREKTVYFNISHSQPSSGVFKFSAFTNSGAYVLTEDKPVLIGCESTCFQMIALVVSQGNYSILHNGDGYIKLITSEETVYNKALVLACASPTCKYSLNATLQYGGSMQVSFESNGATEVEWRSKPMSIPTEAAPRHFYMRVSRYSDFTYFNFILYSSGAELTVYYNIISLNQSYTNTINYSYPTALAHDAVSYGDPLQQMHIVDIDTKLLGNRKCKQRHVVCIATFTVVLNRSVEYSAQYVTGGLGYFSSNTYEYDISPGWPVSSLKQWYSLSYFTHAINFTGENTFLPYRIHLQPLSNCRPQIQTEHQGYLFNHYRDTQLLPLMPGQSHVTYRVLSNSACMFDTGLSTVPLELVFPNVLTPLQTSDQTGAVAVVYQHSSWSDSFRVRVDRRVSQIIVNTVKYSANEEGQLEHLVIPNKSEGFNIGYVENGSYLLVNTPVGASEFVIYIKAFNSSSSVAVLVQQYERPIVVLHNQEHVYQYDPSENSIGARNEGVVEYEYHTTNSFYIFADVNKLAVRMTVRDADVNFGEEAVIINKTINNSSDPWVLVNVNNTGATPNIYNYIIKFEFTSQPTAGSTATLKMHTEELGASGLRQVYPGVSTYDAFVHGNALNCYKYTTPMMMGESDVVVDLNFKGAPVYQGNTSLVGGFATLMDSSTRLGTKELRVSPSAYRMAIKFVAGKDYKICFVLNSFRLVGSEYSVAVNVPTMPMIYPEELTGNVTVYADNYKSFEFVNYQFSPFSEYSEVASFTVINCLGQSEILASQSYSDVMTGKLANIQAKYSYDGVTAGLVAIPHGYYYFGVNNRNLRTKHLFRVSLEYGLFFDDGYYLVYSHFKIGQHEKPKLSFTSEGGKSFIQLRVPGITHVKNANTKIQPTRIVYSLYVIQNDTQSPSSQPELKFNLETYIRCPSVYALETDKQELQPAVTRQVTGQDILNNNSVEFRAEIKSVEFVYGVKAEVYVQDKYGYTNKVEYYYGYSDEVHQEGFQNVTFRLIKIGLLVLLVIVLLVGVAVFGVKFYRRYKATQLSRNVNFEQFGAPAQEMQPRAQPDPLPQEMQTSRVSNTRPLNPDKGYGQFVDEA